MHAWQPSEYTKLMSNDTFLQQQATTQHFSLGAPRSFALSKDGSQVFFVRSKSGDDPQGCLWKLEVASDAAEPVLIVDPRQLKEQGDVPEAEKRRRERAREAAGGIVSFSIDELGHKAVFVVAGDLYIAEAGEVRLLLGGEGAFDPRLSPDGTFVAFVTDGSLRLLATGKDATPTTLAADEGEEVTWGMADFIASEEMGRMRGFWWSPDSQRLIAEFVDNNPVKKWYIAQPANPAAMPQSIRYPAAGTSNARLGLALIDTQGRKTPIKWDTKSFEYLVDVVWERERPFVVVQSRDQKTVQVLQVDPTTGATTVLDEITDDHWVELGSTPLQLTNGNLVQVKDQSESRRLFCGKEAVTPPHLVVRAIHALVDSDTVIFSAWEDDPKAWSLWELPPAKTPRKITEKNAIYGAVAQGKTLVIRTQDMKSPGVTTTVLRRVDHAWTQVTDIKSNAITPPITPRVAFHVSKDKQCHTALLLPQNYQGDKPLPVLLDPYGGPGAQRVIAAQAAYFDAQWWANQGFAVLITDNRGTPGRGPAWEKTLSGDLISPVLEDQITALQDVAAHDERLDVSRVGIKGWSFGGYLAAYAVVRHPEIFHAAVAGAPVTDWRLYDTHYTERYLGDPHTNKATYDACSLLEEAHKLSRPLLLIHGLADDNVVVAHSLQLSSALLVAGRPHQVLPLSGVTHMASQAEVAENLEKLQLAFLQTHLAATT